MDVSGPEGAAKGLVHLSEMEKELLEAYEIGQELTAAHWKLEIRLSMTIQVHVVDVERERGLLKLSMRPTKPLYASEWLPATVLGVKQGVSVALEHPALPREGFVSAERPLI